MRRKWKFKGITKIIKLPVKSANNRKVKQIHDNPIGKLLKL